jgi:hypothetical protein
VGRARPSREPVQRSWPVADAAALARDEVGDRGPGGRARAGPPHRGGGRAEAEIREMASPTEGAPVARRAPGRQGGRRAGRLVNIVTRG